MISRINGFLKKDGIYVLMVFCLIMAGIVGNVMSPDSDTRKEQRTKISDMRRMQSEMELNASDLMYLQKVSPVSFYLLFGVFLMISWALLLGLVLLIVFIFMQLSGRNIMAITHPLEKVRWKISDIVRYIILIMFLGKVFFISESIVLLNFGRFSTQSKNILSMINTGVFDFIALLCVGYFVVKKYGYKLKRVSNGFILFIKNTFKGLLGYMSMVPVIFGILIFSFWLAGKLGYDEPVSPIYDILTNETRSGFLMFFSVIIALFGPVVEEVVFRGFIYRAFRDRFGLLWGMIISAGLFSVLHDNLIGFAPIMLLGILFCYIYEKTGSLLVPIVLHCMHNGVILIVSFVSQNAQNALK